MCGREIQPGDIMHVRTVEGIVCDTCNTSAINREEERNDS